MLFNMLTLWMFGVELERMWGTRFFLKFYFACGVGAGADHAARSSAAGGLRPVLLPSTIGASGAIFGILLAYALVLPEPADPDVLRLPGAGEVLRDDPRRHAAAVVVGGGGGVAHTAHLGGLVTGYLYLKRSGSTSSPNPVPLSQVAHQPHAAQVRRVFRRPRATTSTAGCIRSMPAPWSTAGMRSRSRRSPR